MATKGGGLESSVIVLREALQRVAAQRGVDRSGALAEIDRLLDEARRDPQVAGVRLSEAYARVRAEIRELAQEQGATAPEAAADQSETRLKPSYERSRASAGALRDALARISAEEGRAEARAKLSLVDSMLAEADAEADAGRWGSAQQRATLALDAARAAIRQVREGTTQVRSLNFASAEEEYRYELERYASYRLLFETAVEPERVTGVVAQRKAEAEALRVAAEAEATAGRHGEAVRQLEEAARLWIRALRAAGVYLPG